MRELRGSATYRRNEDKYTQWAREQEVTRATGRVPARAFPISGCAASALSAVFALAFIVVAAVFSDTEGTEMPQWGAWVMGAAVNAAVLGVSLGLASLLSKFRFKPLSILAMIGAGLIIVGYALLLLG